MYAVVLLLVLMLASSAHGQYTIEIPQLQASLAVQNLENAVSHLADGSVERAKELLRAHLSTFEELVPTARILLGYLYVLHGSEVERAINVFEDVLDQHQEYPEIMAAAYTGLGLAHIHLKALPEKTVRYFQKVSELPFNHFYNIALLTKSEALVFQRRYRESVEELASVSSFTPGLERHPGLYGTSDEAHFEMARIRQYWLRDYEGALELYQKVVQKFPDSILADWSKLSVGIVNEILGNSLGARLAYEKHQKLYTASLARRNSIRYLERVKAKSASKTLFLDLEEEERNVRNEYRESVSVFHSGPSTSVDYIKSIDRLKKLIVTYPANPEAARALNKIALIQHFFLHERHRAREAWNLILTKYPGTRTDHLAAFFLALTTESNHHSIQKAIAAYDHFTTYYPQSPLIGPARLRTAILRLQIPGQERETVQALEECANTMTDFAPVANFLAGLLIHFRIGDRISALPFYQAIIENYFNSGFADEALFLIGCATMEEYIIRDAPQYKEQALKTFEELEHSHPNSPYLADTERIKDMISKKEEIEDLPVLETLPADHIDQPFIQEDALIEGDALIQEDALIEGDASGEDQPSEDIPPVFLPTFELQEGSDF